MGRVRVLLFVCTPCRAVKKQIKTLRKHWGSNLVEMRVNVVQFRDKVSKYDNLT